MTRPFVTYTWPATFDWIPTDHGYQLYSALSHALQPMHEGSWQVCPIAGKPDGRRLRGPGQIQVRGPLAQVMIGALNHLEIRVGRKDVRLGRATVSEVRPAPRLAARFVTIKNAVTEDGILAHLVERLHTMFERIPEIMVGRRRVSRIAGKLVVGFEVVVSGLADHESLTLQAEGIGGRRRMGGGVFLPAEDR